MRTYPLSEVLAVDSSVFIDNVALCSADRVLGGAYESVRGNPLLHEDSGEAPAGPATLIAHDLVNLSILVESLLCFDHLFTNADFMDRWNSEVGTGLLRRLEDIVVGVLLSRDQRWEAESAVVRSEVWLRAGDGLDAASRLASLVAHANHDCWTGSLRDWRGMEALLTPYDEASRPFGGSAGIAIGAGFYVMCSQALGIPYRPSAIRAELMRPLLERELHRWRFEAGSLSLEYLELSRREAAEAYFGKLATLNAVDLHMPLVLGGVLSNASSGTEVLEITLVLRDSMEGRAFREWSGQTSRALQDGDMRGAARLLRELQSVVHPINQRLGVRAAGASETSLTLGYGPVSVSRAFQLPSILGQLRPIKSHIWLLQGMYRTLMSLSSFSSHVERVLFPGLPSWLRAALSQRPIDWRNVDWRARPGSER